MTTILRWFHDDGVRYRAYFRHRNESTRELVIAAPEWQAARPEQRSSLEEYTEEELIGIARHLRTRTREEPSSRAD